MPSNSEKNTNYIFSNTDSIVNAILESSNVLFDKKNFREVKNGEQTGKFRIGKENSVGKIVAYMQCLDLERLSPTASKLLFLTNVLYVKNNFSEKKVEYPISKIAELYNIKDKRQLREQIHSDSLALMFLTFTFISRKKESYHMINLFDSIDYQEENDSIAFLYSRSMLEALNGKNTAFNPKQIFSVNIHTNPYALSLFSFLGNYLKLRMYDRKAKKCRKFCVITVERLLKVIFNNRIFKMEKQIEKGQLAQSLWHPLLRELNYLENIVKMFHFELVDEFDNPVEKDYFSLSYNQAKSLKCRLYYPDDYPRKDFLENFKHKRKNKKPKKQS